MATITTIDATDGISASRTDINANFDSLNANKIETDVIDTDTALAANSDSKIASQKATKTYVDTVAATTFLVPTGAILPYGGSTAPSNFLLCDGSAVARSTYNALLAIIGTTFGVGDGSTTFNLPDLRSRFPLGKGTGTKVATFASRAGNVITVTGLTNVANNEFQTGQAVTYVTTGTVITGLSDDTVYYIVRISNTTFSLATSVADAVAGTVISLSGDGTGTQTFTQALTARTLGDTGGEENHALTIAELAAHTHTDAGSSNAVNPGSVPTVTVTADGNTITSNSTGGSTAHSVMSPFVTVNYIIKT